MAPVPRGYVVHFFHIYPSHFPIVPPFSAPFWKGSIFHLSTSQAHEGVGRVNFSGTGIVERELSQI
jgi:hypothetical protein